MTREIIFTEKEAIRSEILRIYKLDIALFNEKEKVLLDKHIDRISLQPYKSIDDKITMYMGTNLVSFYIDLQIPISCSFLLNDIERYKRKNNISELNLKKGLAFDKVMFQTTSKKNRDKMMKEYSLVFEYIRKDFSNIITHIRENQDNEGRLQKISIPLSKKNYRFNREFYSFDLQIENDQLIISNFSIKKGISKQCGKRYKEEKCKK